MSVDIKKLISQMTLEEKVSMCSGQDFWNLQGIERLGIPSVMVCDGPHGLRKQYQGAADHAGIYNSVPATCFPSAAGLASTWNRNLLQRVGVALGEECQAEEIAVLLGPGANIKRSPLCGRNFEYFSEDPYLSSEMAGSHIKGVQSQGVGTSLKHFAANNQEHRRMTIDAIIDERTLREIYLASFEGAVKQSQPWTVMSSYNKVNGEYAAESKKLLTDILRDDWGFQGFVVSDWGAVNEREKGVASGLDLEMPSSYGNGEGRILAAISSGELSEKDLDTAVERVLTVIFKAVDQRKKGADYDRDEHHQLAREAASESMVLLKNEGAVLPLASEGKLAVIGAFAKQPRFQGGGSSHVNPTKLDDVFQEMQTRFGSSLLYAEGYQIDSDDIDQDLIEEAKQIAEQADKAVIFAGLPDRYESEGYDREHLHIPKNHRLLIEAVAEVNSQVIVVLSNGAPVEMPWLPKVQGLLEGYLGGQAQGGAITDILFGDANPSGRLAETFPVKLSDNPSFLNFPGEGDKTEYKEGIFVGYRYYDKKGVEPLFPFGFGLSYTEFQHSDLKLDSSSINDQEALTVSVTVKNTGSAAGQEVVQLYVRDVKSTVIRPNKELKGFSKVMLQPGEEKTVSMILKKRAFSYYNTEIKDFHVESGEFEILIGKSSRDITLKKKVMVSSSNPLYSAISRNTTVGDLLAHPVLGNTAKELLANINEKTPMGGASEEGGDAIEMMEAMMRYMPLRALANFSEGTLTEEMLTTIIDTLNEELQRKVNTSLY
ncbi:glycosyl hydrolase [Bacillus lacus]|uniref:Glycosyl hydrolase n=1 Tax=Metabacillus lacus TaxID=1983721 RepID=A0A7X2M0V7_9BACI|nr:glycoside hydrolase family 3 C-terminal domain-containing protein [Metabacillus lacus]MRX73717.1 glycosyl hydrolase [Metabacillus lacus]